MTIALIDGDVIVYQAIWGTSTIEEAKENFDNVLNGIIENTFATDWAMAIGTKKNFRKDIYDGYKGNRDKAKDNRAEYHPDLARWASEKEGAIACVGYEADDLLRVWSNDCIAGGSAFVICSVDKDLKCIAGAYYDIRKGVIEQITTEYANKFYWQQVLTGDSTDNIPGLYKVGPVKANKILDSDPDGNYKRATCRAYLEHYDGDVDEAYNRLLANGKLIHIWRHIEDYFKVPKEDFLDAIK